MVFPLIPIALVPHSAGGLILTGKAGYIAGTYVSAKAVAATKLGAAFAAGAGTGAVAREAAEAAEDLARKAEACWDNFWNSDDDKKPQ